MQRTRNEKLLLAVLIAVVFLIGNFYGYKWISGKQAALKREAAGLRADQAEARLALTESDQWTQRKAWVSNTQPALTDEGTAKAETLDSVLKGARAAKLEVLEQNLNDIQKGTSSTRVNVSVKVKGSMQDIVKWLAKLEKPDDFYAVSLLSLRADQDQKSMVCTVQIARYFKPGSPS